MKLIFLGTFLVSILVKDVVESARILAVVPTPSFSHQVAFQQLWTELSLKGHQVTLLTTDPIKNNSLTNLTQIDVNYAYKILIEKHKLTKLFNIAQSNGIRYVNKLRAAMVEAVEDEMKHPSVQDLIHNNTKGRFDLVMAEYLHPTMYAFAEIYKCPLIGISSMDTLNIVYESMGNPAHPAMYPEVSLPFLPPLNLIERIISVSFYIYIKLYVRFKVTQEDNDFVKKHFGKNLPELHEIRKRMSLFFVNTDPIFNTVRPLVPAIIPFGSGSHMKSPQALPQTILDLMEGKEVIYFSLGSNIQYENLDKKAVETMAEAFSEIPYQIIWKFNFDNFTHKFSNVHIFKWLPQQDILRHPNVKLFITQGGWQSIQEGVYTFTPMLGLPICSDQPMNMKKMVQKGVALSLDHKSMTKEAFKSAIIELINNPMYLENVKKLAFLAQDQPIRGIKKAIWWIEYVVRHKGAPHLKSPYADIPLYQYYFLDIIICLLLLLTLIIGICLIVLTLIRKALRRAFGRERKLKKL